MSAALIVDNDSETLLTFSEIFRGEGFTTEVSESLAPWSMIQRGSNASGWQVAECRETLRKLSGTPSIVESTTSHLSRPARFMSVH